MVPLLQSLSSHHFFFRTNPTIPTTNSPNPRKHPPLFQRRRFNTNSLQNDAFDSFPLSSPKPEPRTLFPGGYKRPEIKVPNIVLRVDADEVLADKSVLDFIDGVVAKRVGIVVVDGGDMGGGKLYEAACLLKSVIRDRAFLLVAERVDIAAAVNASGVVLSDQGLPAIVARSTMMNSKSDSVVLPVVGRIVQTVNSALTASISEGADFLICRSVMEQWSDIVLQSINESVKIPIFIEANLTRNDLLSHTISKLLTAGASGLVTTLDELKSVADVLSKVLYDTSVTNKIIQDEVPNSNQLNLLNTNYDITGEADISSIVKLEEKEVQFIKKERRLLVEAANAIEKAAPLMEEISLLHDAISQLDEPFLLVIVGEFNSGKSTVINALLGGKFLKEGVLPTTNEITFLRYCDSDSKEQQRCETHPDGQYTCYLRAQILRKMVIVDTPGTNVILQRQQRLTEEFVPRADLLLFVLSADRPLSESEVAFLRYTQQWKKKVVFLLNKADIYRNSNEVNEAITFVSENVKRLLNIDNVTVFPVSARSALEEKLATNDGGIVDGDAESSSGTHSFEDFENFLYGFMDGSTSTGLERMKIKLETPIRIAERLLSSCQTIVLQDCRYAKKDLASMKEIMGTVEQYALRMENESISWRRQFFSLVESAKGRVLILVESTLQLSNLDLAVSLVLKGDKSASIPATQSVQNDIVGPAVSDALRVAGEYSAWLKENNAYEAKRYKETFEKRWPSFVDSLNQPEPGTTFLVMKADAHSIKSIEKFSAAAASKLFDQEIRQVFFAAFGGLGAAGLSASLLTSVLPTTLEDLALGLCSAGGLLAISNFPARRRNIADKVKSIADAVGKEIEEAMQKDLLATIDNMNDFVAMTGKSYVEVAQQKVEKLLDTQAQLTDVEKKLQALQVKLQNLHLS